jgi:transposase
VIKLSRKCLEVKTLHGLTLDQLQDKYNKEKNNFTRSVYLAVIMRYKGISTTIIMKTLNKSRATITSYINNWNIDPISSTIDNRGGNIPSKLTDSMVEDILHILKDKSPSDFGYLSCSWNSVILSKYIEDKYGNKFCDSWLRKLLENLGFSYKRGIYQPTKADPDLQAEFKKNGNIFGYN